MYDSEHLWHVQAALEGIRLDQNGRLERFKEMPGESGPPPRLMAVDTGDSRRVCFGAGVDPDVVARLQALPFELLFSGEHDVFELLGRPKRTETRAEYWTYTLSSTRPVPASSLAQRLSANDERLRHLPSGFFGIPYEHVFAALIEDDVAAAAAPSREDGTSAEVWIFTRPEHRRRGLAKDLCLAWLRDVGERGLIPFYTHVPENLPSRRLAGSLPLSLAFVQACYQ
jgi:RimJ/RimL family protein N-acetyltransferase